MARLRTKYTEDVVPAMIKEFGYKNPMQVPKLNKITINVGLG
ncbi:MAG TPA: 50S ribosomal protein L5, partial [Candidatus Binatia bacterium]